jgi:hypothetical protein
MSKVPWQILRSGNPRAHLLAGAVQTDQPLSDSDLKRAQAGLERLVRKLEPTGMYATTIVRDVGRPEVLFAFEFKGDARKLAAAVNAEATVGYSGWATQQTFLLDDVMTAALLASAPLPMTKRAPRNNLEREIFALGKIIKANFLTLTSRTMTAEDREALARQMALRMARRRLLQKQLNRRLTG